MWRSIDAVEGETGRTSPLPARRLGDRTVRVAATRRARLLGLALLDREQAPLGLLIPGCRAIHTFGMRFALDVVFFDRAMSEVSRRDGVRPRRLAFERRAWAVLELPSGAES